MKAITKTLLVSIISLIALSSFAQKKATFEPKEIYKTSSLVITKISENAFKHVPSCKQMILAMFHAMVYS